jgi:hypothetical protein
MVSPGTVRQHETDLMSELAAAKGRPLGRTRHHKQSMKPSSKLCIFPLKILDAPISLHPIPDAPIYSLVQAPN